MTGISGIVGVMLCLCGYEIASGQIAQDQPELCGNRDKPESIPDGLSVTIDPVNGLARLKEATGQTITLGGNNSTLSEVCSVDDHIIVVFGFNGVGYEVNIVNLATAAVRDSFRAFDPIMSPDRHWIASRYFHAPQTDIPIGEEYLLYDVTASAAANLKSTTPATVDATGWAMYPMFPGGLPFDLADVPEAQVHEWRSGSFFSARDSRSVVFADKAQGQLSVILVSVSAEHAPQAYGCRNLGRRSLTQHPDTRCRSGHSRAMPIGADDAVF